MDVAGKVTLGGGKVTLGGSSPSLHNTFHLWSSAITPSSGSGQGRALGGNRQAYWDANTRMNLAGEVSKISRNANSAKMSIPVGFSEVSCRLHKSKSLNLEESSCEFSETMKEGELTGETEPWVIPAPGDDGDKTLEFSGQRNAHQEKAISQDHSNMQLKQNLKLIIDLQQECEQIIRNNNHPRSPNCYQNDPHSANNELLERNNNRRNSWILDRLQDRNRVTTCAEISCPGEKKHLPTASQSTSLPIHSTSPLIQSTSTLSQKSSTLPQASSTHFQHTSTVSQFPSTIGQSSSSPNHPSSPTTIKNFSISVQESSPLIQSSTPLTGPSSTPVQCPSTPDHPSSPIIQNSKSITRPSSTPSHPSSSPSHPSSPLIQCSSTVNQSSSSLLKRSSSLGHSSSTPNPPTSSLSSWKFATPFLCHRCSSPCDQSPILSTRDSDSLCGSGQCSQYHTPIGSPGPSTPRHRARTPQGKEKHKIKTKDSADQSEERINYYPKCDATIWIRSCTQEVIEPLTGVQSGVIPGWLRGTLIRNGPGRVQVGEYQYNHVFDGSALLHRFHFKDGKVTYQNKFLESRSYLRDTQAQRIVVNYFGTRAHPDPCKTILQNIASKFSLEEHFTDNAQISLYPYGDGLYALTETPFMYRVDPNTLSTHHKVDLTRHIAVLTHTAHPHVDRDGTVYNIGQGVGPLGPRYHICKFPNTRTDAKGKVKTPFEQAVIVGSVGARWLFNPCYMHSFAMTDNYWVIIEQPLVVSVAKMLKVLLKQDALIDSLQWWEKEQTKLHVVRRDTGRVTSTQYVTETFFFLHTINAYEDKGHIVLDIAAYRNAEMLHCMFVEALKNAAYDPTYAQMFRGRPKRWVLPLYPERDAGPHANLVTLPHTTSRARWVKKKVVYVTPELLADIGCEVPRIYYEEYNGRYYQYFYAICSDVDHPKPGTLVKVDVVNKRHLEWSEDNVYPSEPIFVPSPHAKREDEGVVLSALLRAEGRDREVCLLILDAASFTELGRVEFTAPGPVPKCLHGWFVPEGALGVYREEAQKEEEEKK